MERQERTAAEQTTAEKLEALGIDAWERGEMKRYYVNENDIPRVFDAEVRHGSRAVKVYVDGKYGWTKAVEIGRGSEIYYDAASNRWMHGHNELSAQLINALRV